MGVYIHGTTFREFFDDSFFQNISPTCIARASLGQRRVQGLVRLGFNEMSGVNIDIETGRGKAKKSPFKHPRHNTWSEVEDARHPAPIFSGVENKSKQYADNFN